MNHENEIRLPALRIRQGQQHIYTFGVDGKRLDEFATVSRAHRPGVALHGYQRPEVRSHIRAIRQYLESDRAMLPNAIVLAFNEQVKFVPSNTRSTVDYVTTGELVIPVNESVSEDQKPAWLVDGQQRSAAIRDAELEEYAVAAVGFIAHGEAEQRSQFILVNNTKPLPKGLIHELLPDTSGHLPPSYARKQLPATVLSQLNLSRGGNVEPFAGRISTPTMENGYIKDNSVLKMIENSIYEGALYQYRNPEDGTGDVDQMVMHLNFFWKMVQTTFPEAWDLPPTKSRLTHGAGIQSLGYVMDSLTDGVAASDLPNLRIDRELASLADHCAWTSGNWKFREEEPRRWNGIQNTPIDVKLLTNHLLRALRD